MPEYCTCGAKLVDDARFCHRCGRPTREEPVTVEERPAAVAPPPMPTKAERLAQLPVSFANPIALRIGFMLAMMVLLAQNIPLLQVLFVVWWLAAGWVGVLWYRRLTGSALTVNAGARLGFITGVMIFVAVLINTSIEFLIDGAQQFQDAMQSAGAEIVKQYPAAAQMMNDPAFKAAVMLVDLGVFFAVVVGICAAGGALGARFTLRRANG